MQCYFRKAFFIRRIFSTFETRKLFVGLLLNIDVTDHKAVLHSSGRRPRLSLLCIHYIQDIPINTALPDE